MTAFLPFWFSKRDNMMRICPLLKSLRGIKENIGEFFYFVLTDMDQACFKLV